VGQMQPRNFPPPGEYRGIGVDNNAVASAKNTLQVNGTQLASTPNVPTIQSPNSTAIPKLPVPGGITSNPITQPGRSGSLNGIQEPIATPIVKSTINPRLLSY
jgi:hypothetical protein